MNKLKKEKGLNDFVLLEHITEEEFMKNLKVRYEDDAIYTFIGNVVVSINPYKQLPIYTNEIIENYRARFIYELPPHIYSVASDAHRDMNSRKRDQCIIISGTVIILLDLFNEFNKYYNLSFFKKKIR